MKNKKPTKKELEDAWKAYDIADQKAIDAWNKLMRLERINDGEDE